MNVLPKMTYLKSLSLYLILLCSCSIALAQEQEEEGHSNLKNDRLSTAKTLTASLQAILNHLKPTLKPDIRNGLVRVALLNIESPYVNENKIILEALQQQLESLNHVLAIDQDEISKYAIPLEEDPIPFDLARKLSLSRLLGVRYAFSGKLSKNNEGFILELEVISLKKLSVIAKSSIVLKENWVQQLVKNHLLVQTKASSIWRSALIPGWGQLHQDQESKGILYMGLSLTTLGLAVYSQLQANDYLSRYEKNLVSSVDDRADAKLYQSQANLLWMGLAGIWLTNIVDSIICSENKISISPFANQKGANGVMLSTEF
jgi:hypothetical protein